MANLAVELSKLKVFVNPKIKEEQYPTDSQVAAEVLWNAAMLGDIKGKTIADFGCGTGILGIGALFLEAKKVFFVDNDADALRILLENLKKIKLNDADKVEILDLDVKDFPLKTDVVIQNPPFGTKTMHADKEFLQKAFRTAPVVYSFHKYSTIDFLKKFSADKGFRISHIWRYSMPLKQTMKGHVKKAIAIDVVCVRCEKA